MCDDSSHAAAGGRGPQPRGGGSVPPTAEPSMWPGYIVKLVTYVFYGSREKFTKKIFLFETSNVQAILVLLPYLDRQSFTSRTLPPSSPT